MRRRLLALPILVAACTHHEPGVRVLAYDDARGCPAGDDAAFLLRNRRGGDAIVTVDGAPQLRLAVTCTYDVAYAAPGCPAPMQLSISRAGTTACPSAADVAPALIEAHGLASSPCESVTATKLAGARAEKTCVYPVTTRRGEAAGGDGFRWVVLH